MEITLTRENCQKIINVIKDKQYKIKINNNEYKCCEIYDKDIFCVYNNMDYDSKFYYFKDNTVVDLEVFVMEPITSNIGLQ